MVSEHHDRTSQKNPSVQVGYAPRGLTLKPTELQPQGSESSSALREEILDLASRSIEDPGWGAALFLALRNIAERLERIEADQAGLRAELGG